VAKSTSASETRKSNQNNTIANIYAGLLDGTEKEFDLAGSDATKDRLSYGLLTVDLISGGGLVAGMTTASGQEQSGKSTLTLAAIRSGIQAKIPIICHYDAEGTAQSDTDYVAAILRVKSLDEIYGQKVNGVWRIPPKVRYWDTTILEKYFNSMVRTLNRLPDKIYLRERGQWFLRVARDGKAGKQQAAFLKLGDPDGKLSNKNFSWIPTTNAYPQALIVPDSYVTFLPEDVDNEEEATNALAEQAREFAKHLRRIVGKFKRKQVVVFGVNQWRDRPGMVMGPKNYEPAGNALKLYSSVRYTLTPRAVPNNWRHEAKFSQYNLEPSVEGDGDDAYAYKHIKNIKNKAGTPWQECWTRVWVKDRRGRGRGFDPVYDTAQFLFMTGLAKEGKRHLIQFAKSDLHPFSGKQLSWHEFKALIIAEEYRNAAAIHIANKVLRGIKGGGNEIRLRALCFRWLRNGKALELFNAHVATGSKARGFADLEAD
jgi:hypothetical protein